MLPYFFICKFVVLICGTNAKNPYKSVSYTLLDGMNSYDFTEKSGVFTAKNRCLFVPYVVQMWYSKGDIRQ